MNDLFALRQKAESATAKLSQSEFTNQADNLSVDELNSLLHELKVYQIELEMQNDELRQTQNSLSYAKEEFKNLFEHAPVAYLNLDQYGIIKAINLTGVALFAIDRQRLIGAPLLNFIHTDYQSIYIHHLSMTQKNRQAHQNEIKIVKADKSISHVLIESNIQNEPDTPNEYIRMIITDIDELQKMRKNEKLAARVIENSMEGVVITDQKGLIISVNKTFTKITGYSSDEAIDKSPNMLQSGKHDKEFYSVMWQQLTKKGHWQGEIWNRRKDGEVYQEWLDISSVKDDLSQVCNYVAKFTDLADCKKAENRLHFLAHFDQLTELPNRVMFTERLAQSINSAERSGKKTVVFFMDLDGFKGINDSLGHNVGDLLLKQVAIRLKSLVRKIDVVSRIGGDEFTLIANEIEHSDQIIFLANKILNSFSLAFLVEEHKIFIGTSIGISVFPDDGIRGSDLVKYADTAMYQAKESGRSQYCFYTREMGKLAAEQLQLSTELHKAIECDELILHYQPQYDLNTGKMIGLEALVRWLHSEKGLLPPIAFIPEAEKSNLIVLLGEWVLKQVCRQIELWFKGEKINKKDPIRIAVNISPKQFEQLEFEHLLKRMMDKCSYSENWLELEITEQTLLRDLEKMIQRFDRIKKMHINLAIDDFGTGYSSMSYLQKFPIDILKIDRSFIKDIDIDRDNEAIIKAIIQMAHGLDIKVLAEGVETKYQKEFLQKLNCDMVQGFLYAKPMPAEQISFKDIP